MDKNRDGVVTIEEFIETCQKVNHTFTHHTQTDTQTGIALSKPKSQRLVDTNWSLTLFQYKLMSLT